jgi:hypothetical protein
MTTYGINNITGPLFDGIAEIEAKALAAAVQREIAEYAEFQWQMNMTEAFQHPTGYYQSRVNIARSEASLSVNDGGVIYGPWLEGVGSRNETTRFKGYFSARRAANSVAQKSMAIALPLIEAFVAKANGV